jgi:hypothetical protein
MISTWDPNFRDKKETSDTDQQYLNFYIYKNFV